MDNFKRIRHAGPGRIPDSELDELIAQGWYPAFTYLGYFSFWLRRGGGGNVDLTEILNRLDGFDIAIDQIGQTHDRMQKEIDELKQGGGVNPGPSEFEFDVWGCVDGGECKITKPSSIKDEFGVVFGNTLSARFTINQGTTLADGVLYIVPEVQPTGYCHFFNGTFVHNCDKHGYMANGVARWHRRNEFGGGKWGIRMQYDTFCLLRTFSTPSKYDLPWMLEGGAWYAQGRSGKVLTAFGGDCFEVTIPFA